MIFVVARISEIRLHRLTPLSCFWFSSNFLELSKLMYKIHFLRLKVSYIGFIVGLYCVILVFRYKNEESPLGGSLGYHGSKVNLVADIIRCV